MDDNIRVKVNWLMDEVGISREDIGFVALYKIYPFSLDTLKERINNLSSFNFSKDEISTIITNDASILHKSVENIKLKYDFLENGYQHISNLNEEILEFPKILGYV